MTPSTPHAAPQAPAHAADALQGFLDACEGIVDSHPHVVVHLMHEYARNLYPADPHLPLAPGEHRLDAAVDLLKRLAALAASYESIPAYPRPDAKGAAEADLKVRTGRVYGDLWERYPGDLVAEAADILSERFVKSGFDMDRIKGLRVLDHGCGSGRYACALARLGAAEVVGVDYGDQGLAKGRALAKAAGLANVAFEKGSLLDLPFPDESFDFVFSNGTLHHTGDIAAGTRELYRVLRTGGLAWYYIYGAGGLFWLSRRAMNRFMKAVPREFAQQVLDLLGMPMNRFIFMDNWYVPVETHTSDAELRALLGEVGFSSLKRADRGRPTDFDCLAVHGTDKDRAMWGDGELRYFLTK